MNLNTVLNYWFGEIRESMDYLNERYQIWFRKQPAVDAYLREHFTQAIRDAKQDKFRAWEASPRGRLALVVLLDQFSRHVYRDTPDAFAQDKQCRQVVHDGLQAGVDRLLHPIERTFFYLPLEHSETLSDQELSLSCFDRLVRDAPGPLKSHFEEARDYAVKHYDIIDQFGRFPHRNQILKRNSTPEELEFLKTPGSSF